MSLDVMMKLVPRHVILLHRLRIRIVCGGEIHLQTLGFINMYFGVESLIAILLLWNLLF